MARNYRLQDIRTASPVLRDIFTVAHNEGITVKDFREGLKVGKHSIHHWRSGNHTPDIMAVESLANFLGYKLTLEKIDE